jgi:hypothetical protein
VLRAELREGWAEEHTLDHDIGVLLERGGPSHCQHLLFAGPAVVIERPFSVGDVDVVDAGLPDPPKAHGPESLGLIRTKKGPAKM